jgi:hypothetical protein
MCLESTLRQGGDLRDEALTEAEQVLTELL